MRARSLFFCLSLVVLGSACHGFSPVRLAEQETRRGNITTVKEMTYGDDGRLEEIETRTNGNFVGRLELIWDGGTLVELEYARANQDDLSIELEYKNGRLVGMDAKGRGADYSIELEYWNDDPAYLEEHTLVVQSGNSRTTTRRTVEYDEGRAVGGKEETSHATGGGTVTFTNELEMRWDRDGLPDELRITSKAFGVTSRRDAEYVFADDRRLEEVEFDDGEQIEIEYDRDGFIEEIEITEADGSRTVHELHYDDGMQSGFAFVAPGLPANVLFDLTGRAFERPEVFTDAWFPMP